MGRSSFDFALPDAETARLTGESAASLAGVVAGVDAPGGGSEAARIAVWLRAAKAEVAARSSSGPTASRSDGFAENWGEERIREFKAILKENRDVGPPRGDDATKASRSCRASMAGAARSARAARSAASSTLHKSTR